MPRLDGAEIIPIEPGSVSTAAGKSVSSCKKGNLAPWFPIDCGTKWLKIMRFTLWVGMMLILPKMLFSQQTIRGKVFNKENQEALSQAEVQVKGSFRGTLTDKEGKFMLQDLEESEQTLLINYLGFEKKQLTINPAEQSNLTVGLAPKPFLEDEVLIESIRASRGTPTTYTNVEREKIESRNTGKNMPMILEDQPSVVANSDDGLGIGYSGLRIRGSSQTRVNVTINGIPLNDAESQGVFWVNIPDIASSSENIQIQRGVGTSTNGAGAFGATINLQTAGAKEEPYTRLNSTFGSFNTIKNNLQFGTGMINDNWHFQGSFSRIRSDGFIDRASSDLKSYYLSGGYYGENTIVKGIMFGGREETYQAWLGVPESKMGQFPNSQSYLGDLSNPINNLFGGNADIDKGDRTFNPYTYENQVDNYGQDHYQLHISQEIGNNLNLNGAFHYTYGRGYYEQKVNDASLANHKIDPVSIGDSTIKRSDIVRRRWLDNHFYGVTFSANYEGAQNLNLTLGGAWNQYEGDHFGRLKWARFSGKSEINDEFYDNSALKNDFNIYSKINYQLSPDLSALVDLQYRRVGYQTSGLDIGLINIDESDQLDFFNPKVGINLDINSQNSFYAFAGIANREPTRNDYIDAPADQQPSPERLYNAELGYERTVNNAKLKVNGYFMRYQNQLVQTGEVNDVGAPIRTNVDQSYRAGIEIMGAYRFNKTLQWNGNLTLSRNRILNMTYKVNGQPIEEFEESPIAFTPPVIGSSNWELALFDGFTINLQSKYVGRQYLDNTGSAEKMLSDYLLNDLTFSYKLEELSMFKEVTARLKVNNILNVQYAPNGYTFSFIRGGEVSTQNRYYPQAGRHYMGTLSLKF